MFAAQRTWDPASIQTFNARRDDRRAKDGQQPFSSLSPNERKPASAADKDALKNELWNRMTLQTTPLEKFPMQQAIAPCKGVMICPGTIRSSGHSRIPITKLPFEKGQDLFITAYYHYSKLASEDDRTAKNYVSNDGISPRRHEYLGPEPRMSGFYLEGNEVQILFYDSNLKLPWTAHGTWSLGMEFDETVEAFVPIIQMNVS
ncbi:hypothetical protein GG344DRAFT_74168 [Lentinula edodes]|nr:hypothetical protein GG344DRAFT_74168 [Lentinula edodes]